MSSVIDLAMRVGSYIPHSAGMGGSYLSGSINVSPETVAMPTPQNTRDEYIPSIPEMPEFEIYFGPEFGELPANEETTEEAQEHVPDPQATENDTREIGEYSPEEERLIAELQQRDREVRAHEQAHISAGGAYIRGGATYQYENGPDNQRYAVGGEVSIDTSPVSGNPEATIAKMQVVRSAALAPAEPSAQDIAVAAAATNAEMNAAAELRQQQTEESRAQVEEQQNRRAQLDAVNAYTFTNTNAQTSSQIINLAG